MVISEEIKEKISEEKVKLKDLLKQEDGLKKTENKLQKEVKSENTKQKLNAEPETMGTNFLSNDDSLQKDFKVNTKASETEHKKELKTLIEKSKLLLKKIESHNGDSVKDNFEENLLDKIDDSEF